MKEKYLKVNRKYKEVVDIIKDRIKTNTPFSFTRYGDGEIDILENTNLNDIKRTVCKWYNYNISMWGELCILLRQILINSLNDSEFIGLFDNNGVLKNHMTVGEEWSISKSFLDSYGIIKDFQICDHQLPRSKEIGDIRNFRKILNGNSLHIISPLSDKLKANKISNLLNAPISYTTWPMPLDLNQRSELFKKLDEIKENIVIFGTSIGGKDIGSYLAKNYGKICIDFGATLDAWAGIQSRPWFRSGGVQEHCMVYRNK